MSKNILLCRSEGRKPVLRALGGELEKRSEGGLQTAQRARWLSDELNSKFSISILILRECHTSSFSLWARWLSDELTTEKYIFFVSLQLLGAGGPGLPGAAAGVPRKVEQGRSLGPGAVTLQPRPVEGPSVRGWQRRREPAVLRWSSVSLRAMGVTFVTETTS